MGAFMKEGRKEGNVVFSLNKRDLLTNSQEKEGNVLFNDALVGHMVKDHSDSEKGNSLPPLHWLLFPISSKGYLIYTISQTGYTYHGFCYTNRGCNTN